MSDRRPRSRLVPPLAQKLILSAATVVVALGAAEGLCRLIQRGRPAPPPVAEYINDWGGSEFVTLKSAATGWPPWEDYNSDGLRDREHAVEKPPGARRVACLGDSVTLGYGIRPQEAWPQALQDLFAARGRRTEVFNFAFGGWSTRQELIAYRRLARRYRPDQVLLGVCLNDIPEMQNNLSRPPRFVQALYRRSALVRTVVGAQRREVASVEELFRAAGSAKVREAFRLTFDDVRALKAEVRADGGRLAVIVFPFRFQLLPGAPEPAVQREIAGFCASEGLPFLDVLPALRDLGEAAFIDYDHFSPAGARRVAEAVADSGLVDIDEDVVATPERSTAPSPAPLARPAGKPLSALLAGLRAADPPQRAAAARALGNRGAEPVAAVPALVGALRDPVSEVRTSVAWGLGGFGPAAAAALPALALALADESAGVRAGAAWAVGRIGPAARPASPSLVKLLDDGDESVRWRAGEALAAVGPDPASCLEPLRQMAADPVRPGRAGAAWALGQLGPAAAPAVPALISALSDTRKDVRARATWALGQVGPAAAPAVADLIRMMRDPDNGWRAADALGGIGPSAQAAAGALAHMLADPRGGMRWRAAQALGRFGEAASPAGPALVRALDDPEDNVRLAAARALARMSVDAVLARPALLHSLADRDSRVRAAAARALHRLGPDSATARALAESARSDPDETVRAEARRALKPGR